MSECRQARQMFPTGFSPAHNSPTRTRTRSFVPPSFSFFWESVGYETGGDDSSPSVYPSQQERHIEARRFNGGLSVFSKTSEGTPIARASPSLGL